ncbi:ATP-dependent helicase SGS1 [Acropora cervicornis]|uniref:DNA 3'-5' helicase n=1 Tax=Acropora cervicornis TaxID=6130 RepID=A0AAD9VF45_ACRCE|nr:ATP-dependent helicase SGS1 [Acropora cervicornis]
MLVTELLWRKVKLGDGNIEYVHNARQLLDTLEKDIPWTHRLDVVHKACAGLQYLHENGIIHCDVKAANIFIGGGTTSEYVVKIGDFGQANFDVGQFSLTQHTSFVPTRGASERNKVGTAPYTAPELIELGAERKFPSDVYSMGMVMIEFTLPERSHPWEGEVSSSDLIFHHVQQGRRPTVIPTMLNGLDDNAKEDWLSTINRCLDQDPEKRPPIATVTRVLHNMTTKGNDHLTSSSKVNELVLEGVIVENIPLNVHQGTVVESAGDIAVSLFEHGEGTERVQEELEACVRRLDGTNACIFLAVKNIDNILSNFSSFHATKKLQEQVENAIQKLPEQINDFRDITKYYNIEEAVQLLQEGNLIRHRYNIIEMVQDQLCTSPDEKRTHLRNALAALAADSPSLAIYTCTPVSLVVGFVGDAFLIIDTHRIPADLGGNGNAIIKVVHCNGEVENGGECVLNWLEKRIISSVGPGRGPDSLVRLSFQEKSTTEEEMTSFSEIDDEDALILSVTEDFQGSTEGGDEEDDALLASLPEPEESSARSSDEVGDESQISRPGHSKNHGFPSVKQETKDISSKLWEYPSRSLAHDENTELIWKGHLTKFQLTGFKRFQLDAIRALEAKKDVIVIQKTGSGKSICFQVPSLFDNTKTTVVICPTISLIHSQVESLKGLGINAVAVGPQQQIEIGEETEALPSLIYTTPEYFSKKLKDKLSASNLLKLIVVDEVHKVFDRNSEFRSSYDTLKYLHRDFPGVPVMALTATLNEEHLKALCENYLRRPVLIKSTVDRPNIKLNVGKYQIKRPVKGDKSLVWMDASRQISGLLAEEYGIVYMHFKKDVELMLICLKESCSIDARAYHGGLSHNEKMEVDSQFRNKDFQLLVATESYEVGTHSPHVHSVIRLGCMRNLGVLIQEFGRAGRGGEQADGYLLFN